MIKIDQKLLNDMAEKSRSSKRKRINYNFHKTPEDPLQRLLNTMQPGTYLQPHKHENPDKREVFIALTGRFLALEFDEQGNITDSIVLDPAKDVYAAEVSARTYHSIICLEPDSVIYELKDGPYDPADDKNFASWAPKEGAEGCDKYMTKILNELNIQLY